MARAGWIFGGLAALVGLEIAFSHRASASPSTRTGSPPTPAPPPPRTAPPTLYPSGVPMTDTAYTIDTWRPTIQRLIATEFPRVSEPFAEKWGEIESGWNPAAVGNPGQIAPGNAQPAEIGIGQLYNPDDFHRYGLDPAKFRAYTPEAAPLAEIYRQAKATEAAAIKAGNAQVAAVAHSQANTAARAIQTRTRNLTQAEMDDQVRYTLLHKIADGMATADHVSVEYGLHWPVADYWKLVKAPHALPVILGNGMPAVVKKLGRAPGSWHEFRQVLGMDGNDQWRRALDACETCGNAAAPAVA